MLYNPKSRELKPFDLDEYLKIDEENTNQLIEIDKKQKENGTMLYRYISVPYADGRAYYQITKVNKKTVRIRVCLGIGDEWILPYWGEETSIPISEAETFLKQRDFWDNLKK